jgi:MoaA/NifB/PqqE/SkfB family radical SAM enzyme
MLTNSLFINNQIIKQLANKNITIRISLESMDEKKNDSIRGKGVYNKVLEIIKKLDKNNIKTVIAISESKENLRIANEFIKKNSLNTKIKEIPLFNKGRYTVEFKKEKEKKIIDKVKITKGCITNSNKTFKDFMCHNTRNVGKIDGKIVITPCPIVFKDIILSHNIKDSMREVELTDSACYDYCFKQGGSCSN